MLRHVVGHFIVGHVGAIDDDVIDALLGVHALLPVEIGHDGVGRDAVAPAADLALPVERDDDALRRHRTEPAVGHVVLAALDHLHRLADRFRQQGGVHRVFHERVAAVAAAHGQVVEFHLRRGNARRLRRILNGARRPLGAGPQLQPVRGDGGDAGVGLHLRVVDVVRGELAGVDPRRAGDGAHGVAGGATHHALGGGIAHLRQILGARGFRVHLEAGRVLPLDLQFLTGGEHGLDGLADDAHTMVERHDLHDSRHLPDLVTVERDRTRIAHGTAGEGAVEHPRHAHVDGVGLPAGGLGGHVNARHVLAQQTELGDRLQLFGFQLRHFLRNLREGGDFAVGHAAVRRLVQNCAGLRGQFGERHAPAAGGRLHQHAAGLCACHAAGHPVAAHADAGDDHLRTQHGMIVDRIDRRGLHLHLRPVRVQLFGDDERNRCVDALAHLGGRVDDGDRPVGGDAHVGVDSATGAGGQRPDAGVEPKRESEREAGGAGKHGAAGQAAAGHVRRGHGQPSFDARSMALAMRGYAPQRHRLPSMCWTICSRVGFGVFASSSAAFMIWPDWQ